ncbi:MAG TPA: protein translocase SEC61 complex subunit gamma [Candidatus Binatia bacterium]|nr:protein translocase SEC61 complex subunit gamma [Candidatus Binatia bacterium]
MAELDEITHSPDTQITQQEQPPQIPQKPVPQIATHPHRHKRRKHVSLVLGIVVAAVWAFVLYRMTTTGTPVSLISITIIAGAILLSACIGYAWTQHKRLIASPAVIGERIVKDLKEEVKTIASPKDAQKALTPQGKFGQKWAQFKEFVKECRRVLAITKKPNRQEFKTIVKISGVGILLIGLIGFLIHFAREGLRALGF